MLRTVFLATLIVVLAPLIVVLLAGIGFWATAPSSDELVVYPASCSNEIKILPFGLAIRGKSFDEGFKQYHADRANCTILPLNPTVYKINKARGEVYYKSDLLGTERLVDCSIFSRTDWSCSYPDGGSRVVIIDGLRAIHSDEVSSPLRVHFSLRRWQWWATTLYWWIDRPRGAWLIPEQHRHID